MKRALIHNGHLQRCGFRGTKKEKEPAGQKLKIEKNANAFRAV